MPIDPSLRRQAEDVTQSHRSQFPEPLNSERITKYIKELLPLELRCAESDRDEPARLPSQDKQGGVLVLLVGFSIDPLLQSICAYKPDQVVLVLKRAMENLQMDGPDKSLETMLQASFQA